MRPWLLLLSLLVSDLSPLGDGDGVMENWSLCRKVRLNGQTTPRGPEKLHNRAESCSICIQRNFLHKLKTSSCHWMVCDGHGCSLSDQKCLENILKNQLPVVSLLCAKRESASTLTEQHVVDETARIPMRMIKELLYSGSAWFLHHHSAASGCNFKAFLLKESKNWDPAVSVWLQKMLTKRYSAAETVVISCCFKESGEKGALSIKKSSKNQSVKGQIREKESREPTPGLKVLMKHDGQPNSKGSINRYDTFKAASLYSSEKAQLQKQRDAGRIIKKEDHLSFLLQRSVQRQQSLKASSAYDDDDGFYIKRKLLLVPRERPESINKPQYKIRVTPDDNKENFSRKIITKQAELQRPEGESATERSNKNIENGNQERLTYQLQAGFTHKTDNNGDKEMLSEVGDDILIMFFLPHAERETQMERKLILDAGIKWKTVNIPIKELDDPPPIPGVMVENFITVAHNSECKYLKGILFLLDIYAVREDIKPAEVTTKSAKTEKQVKAAREKIELTETNNAPSKNMSINHTKQDAPSEESVIPSPPSIKMSELEPVETEHTAETTTVNTEIKETTSSADSFNQSGAETEDGPQSTTATNRDFQTDAEPRFIKCTTKINAQTTTENSLSGLRMREAFSVKLRKGRKNREGAARRRPESEREEREPKEDRFTTAEPAKTTQTPATGTPQRKHDNMPPCRGLIHRTEAGWKHCVQRYSGAGSKIFSSGEPGGAFKDAGGEKKKEPPSSIRDHGDSDDDEYDHFYYFDGVLKRVRNNFYPYYKRQRLRRRRRDKAETNVFTQKEKGESHENLLSQIRHLSSRNKDRQPR